MPNPALTPKRPEYYVRTGSMFENPHGVPHEEIVRYILENPAEVVAQVVFGKYVESSGLVFTGELIQNMIDRRYKRVTGDAWIDPEARDQAAAVWASYGHDYDFRRYSTGIDFARQTDYTVISTIDTSVRPAKLVYFKRLNRVPWETIYAEVGKARQMWGRHILVDSTGMGGDVIMDALESRSWCVTHQQNNLADATCTDGRGNRLEGCSSADYLPLACVEGYSFQTASKRLLIEHLRSQMSEGYKAGTDRPFGAIRVPPIVQLEEEMSFYIWEDKKLITDCLMSLALAVWLGLEDPISGVAVGSPWGS